MSSTKAKETVVAPVGGPRNIREERAEADPIEQRREEIFQYIQARLGPYLGPVYAEANRSSISLGCYDHDWSSYPPYPRIEQYLKILREDWASHQGDITPLVARLQHLLAFGTPDEKKLLQQLELLPA